MLMTLILTAEPVTTMKVGYSLSHGWLYTLLGMVLLVMVGLLFTPYRYVLGYFLSGMAYWLIIEGLQWLVVSVTTLPILSSYAWAIGLSLIPLMALLSKFDEVSASTVQFNRSQLLRKFAMRLLGWGKALFAKKPTFTAPPAIAGQRPMDIFKDTDYAQHFIQHSPVFDYEE